MTVLRDNDDRTAQEFLDELFEFSYCSECGGDVEDHEAVPSGISSWFARCLRDPWEDLEEADPMPLDLDAIQRDEWEVQG